MSRLLRLVAVLVVLVTGTVVGCGIPDETEVRVRGAGPSPGLAPGGQSATIPSKRGDTRDREKFISNYLAAAAGTSTDAAERVREFFANPAKGNFKPPSPDLNVIRLLDKPLITPGSEEVTLRVQHVGILTVDGRLESPTAQETKYTLSVSEVEGPNGGLFITRAPQLLLLSDAALAAFYRSRTIYFWNTDRTLLVPDLRYLPEAVTREEAPTQIVKWLIAGPSSWLDNAVAKLPESTRLIGNVVPADGADGPLLISLNAAEAAPPNDQQALTRLGRQLMWSLRPDLTRELILKIAGQPDTRFTGQDYLPSNPAYELADVPERFCVYAGRVSRLAGSAQVPAPVPLVTDQVNRNVRTAGFSRSGDTTYAALVVGEGADQRLLVGAARDGRRASFVTARLPAGAVSRPVWLTALGGGRPEGGVGLIAVAGNLHHFASRSLDPLPMEVPGASGAVTAVAAAPDGSRIAFVAGGSLYVTVVSRTDTALQASRARLVRTSLGKIIGVDWSSEHSLVIAGESGINESATRRVAIIDINVDGGVERPRLRDLGAAQVSDLAAYPDNPARPSGGGAVTYVANKVAYDLITQPRAIEASEVVGAPVGSQERHPTVAFFLR